MITATTLIVSGGIFFAAGTALGGMGGFRFTNEGIKTASDYQSRFVEKTADLKGISELSVSVDDSDIQFLEGDEFRIEYGYREENSTMNEERSDGSFTLTQKYFSTEVFWQGFALGTIPVDYQNNYVRVYLPGKQKLDKLKVDNDYGTIRFVTGDADDFQVINDSGDVTLDGINSKTVNIKMGYGKLQLSNCQMEQLTVNNESGNVAAENLTSKIADISMGYGKNQISNCQIDELKVNNESGQGEFSDLIGSKLTGKYSYGEVSLTDIEMKQIDIDSESGRIDVENVTVKKEQDSDGGLSLHTGYGAIELDQVEADSLDFINDSGNISGKAVKANSGVIKLSSGDCSISEFTPGTVSIESEYGNINLDLTESEADYDFELLTDYGEVTINGDKQGTNFVREKGARNKVNLSTDSGNIKIDTK